jgi:hypothetical protein
MDEKTVGTLQGSTTRHILPAVMVQRVCYHNNEVKEKTCWMSGEDGKCTQNVGRKTSSEWDNLGNVDVNIMRMIRVILHELSVKWTTFICLRMETSSWRYYIRGSMEEGISEICSWVSTFQGSPYCGVVCLRFTKFCFHQCFIESRVTLFVVTASNSGSFQFDFRSGHPQAWMEWVVLHSSLSPGHINRTWPLTCISVFRFDTISNISVYCTEDPSASVGLGPPRDFPDIYFVHMSYFLHSDYHDLFDRLNIVAIVLRNVIFCTRIVLTLYTVACMPRIWRVLVWMIGFISSWLHTHS